MNIYPIIFIIIQSMQMSECYKILETRTIVREYLRPNNLLLEDFDYYLEGNKAFVYKLSENTVLLLPNGWRMEEEGFVLDSEDCLKEMIEKDDYPIDDSEAVYDKKGAELLELHEWIPKYQDILNEALNLKYTEINLETLEDYYTKIKGFQLRGISRAEGVFYLSILVGEYIRRLHNGKFLLEKHYRRFNPYYIVEILTADNLVCTYQVVLMKRCYDGSLSSIQSFLNSNRVKNPSLQLEKISPEIIERQMIILD